MGNQARIDKQRAIELREQGHSYKEIASTLGCSEAWCAKELGKTKKGELVDDRNPIVVKMRAIRILEDALAAVRKL